MSRPLIIGHRGACAYYPENTEISFIKGLEQGAEMFEFDVRLTKDGYPVVMHDNKLSRIAGRPGYASQRTWKFLSQLDVGSWKGKKFAGTRLSLLDDIFKLVAPQVPLNLEMKFSRGTTAEQSRPLVEKVVSIIKDLGLTRRVLVSSFCHEALPVMNELEPEIMTARLYEAKAGPLGKNELEYLKNQPLRRRIKEGDLPFKGRMMCLHHSLATEQFVKEVNKLGGGILCWTVDDPDDMRRLASYGVTGIISNKPDLLKKVLNNL